MAIWNFGSINVDHVYRLTALPLPGQTLLADSLTTGLGGKGANQSVAAARAGAKVRHVGAIAASDDWIIAALQDAGVDCAGIVRLDDTVTGHAIIMVDDAAENAILVHGGANRALTERAVAQGLNGIGPGDTLLLQNETAHQAFAGRIAQAAGARVIYSAAPFDVTAVRAVLPFVSVLALNEGEAAALTAALGDNPGVDGLLVTLGERGAEYRDLRGGGTTRQPAFAVRPVDTTGAGDCFAGWFAAELDAGHGIAHALRTAAAAAAVQVTRPGAVAAMPSRAEVQALLSAQR